MAKQKQETPEVAPESTTASKQTGGGPWMSRRTGMILMALVSLAVVVLVWFSAPEGATWSENLKIALFIVASVWLVFAFTYTLSRWLHR